MNDYQENPYRSPQVQLTSDFEDVTLADLPLILRPGILTRLHDVLLCLVCLSSLCAVCVGIYASNFSNYMETIVQVSIAIVCLGGAFYFGFMIRFRIAIDREEFSVRFPQRKSFRWAEIERWQVDPKTKLIRFVADDGTRAVVFAYGLSKSKRRVLAGAFRLMRGPEQPLSD